jgi:mercuric ion transport protein
MTHRKASASGSASVVSGGSAVSGILAFVGASCCVIPILLVHMGVASGLVAKLGWFARWQPFFLGGAVLLLAISLLLAARQPRRSRLFWASWSVGALFTITALILPLFEFELQRQLLNWIRS